MRGWKLRFWSNIIHVAESVFVKGVSTLECLDVDRDMILPATAKRQRQSRTTRGVEGGYSPPVAASNVNEMVDDIETDSSLSEVDVVGSSSIRRCNQRKRQCHIPPSRPSLSIHPTPPWQRSRSTSQKI